MTTKKIIAGTIGLFLIFAITYVCINKYIYQNVMIGEGNEDLTDAIESEEVEVSDEDKIKAKTTYYPFEEGDIIGYKNLLGDIVKEPSYKSASIFYNGLATVEFDNTNFVINDKFEVISQNFDDITPLINGYFSATRVNQNKDELYLIKPDGKEVKIEGDYLRVNDEYGDYLNNYFIVVNKGKEGLIDIDGKLIIEPIYSDILSVSKVDNELRVWVNKFNKQVLLSEKGEIDTEYKIISCANFNNGLANVNVEKPNGYEYSIFMDKDGNEVKFFKEYNLDYLSQFNEGLMLIRSHENTLVCINENLEIVFEIENPDYENTYEIERQYENGIAIVSKWLGNNAKECYEIDKQGNILRKTEYKQGLIKLDDGNYMGNDFKFGKIISKIYDENYNLISDEEYTWITDNGNYNLAQGKSNLDIYYKGIKINKNKCTGIDSEFVNDNIIKVSKNMGKASYYTCINGKLEQIDMYEE